MLDCVLHEKRTGRDDKIGTWRFFNQSFEYLFELTLNAVYNLSDWRDFRYDWTHTTKYASHKSLGIKPGYLERVRNRFSFLLRQTLKIETLLFCIHYPTKNKNHLLKFDFLIFYRVLYLKNHEIEKNLNKFENYDPIN